VAERGVRARAHQPVACARLAGQLEYGTATVEIPAPLASGEIERVESGSAIEIEMIGPELEVAAQLERLFLELRDIEAVRLCGSRGAGNEGCRDGRDEGRRGSSHRRSSSTL